MYITKINVVLYLEKDLYFVGVVSEDVVLISTVQQSEPAIHTSISPTEHHNNILSYST